MHSRRRFIQDSFLTGVGFTMLDKVKPIANREEFYSYQSDYFKVEFLREKPGLSSLSTDSLGKGRFLPSPLLNNKQKSKEKYKSKKAKDKIIWIIEKTPVWECKLESQSLTFTTHWGKGKPSSSFEITVSQRANHCTVLGKMREGKNIEFPCVLHFPGMGTFRIYCNVPEVTLFYDADRTTEEPFVKIAMKAADKNHEKITYRFESVAIFPNIPDIEGDYHYDGFRRNYINIFQLNPRVEALANNSASDTVAFAIYFYAEMARRTPELVKGLTAMDLIRSTMDRYLDGMKGYGEVGYVNSAGSKWESKYDSSDTFPSLIISSCYYILDQQDREWAEKNYGGIKKWAETMMATDANNDGIIEYGYSGNANSWNGPLKRPANWWDTIGFGHDDAYSNALAYRSCILLAKVAEFLNKPKDIYYFNAFAKKLKEHYFKTFYNQETGILGGWRSADGKLHDYYFTFVNSVAVCYDLVEKEVAKRIMLSLINKMKEVGYSNFRLGLPGNLIPIADQDYAHHDRRWGYQNFQVYENGGATACYVYFTIRALYKLEIVEEADKILDQMLDSYKKGGFMGNCLDSRMTKDWKSWKGKCWGYEGFLAESYLAMSNVLDRFNTFQ